MWSNLLVKRAYNCFNQAVQQTWRIIRLLKRTGRPEARPPDVSVKEQHLDKPYEVSAFQQRDSVVVIGRQTNGTTNTGPGTQPIKQEAQPGRTSLTLVADGSSSNGQERYITSEESNCLSASPGCGRASAKLVSDEPLRNQLGSARIEWPEGGYRYFYPEDVLQQLINPSSVLMELKRCEVKFVNENSASQTAKRIAEFAPKLFTILVCLQYGELIYEFLDEDIDDSHLPFVRSDRNTTRGSVKFCSGKHPNTLIKCMESWDQWLVGQFGQTQWYTQAPIFEFGDGIKHYELDDNCVLPWIEDHERRDRAAEGGFSSVWRVVIHPAHQRLLGAPNSEISYQCIAVKQLHSTSQKSFDLEVEMLKTFKKNQHPHLIKLLATFRLKGKYYLLFPYARSNLREFWKSNPLPKHTYDVAFWVLSQCRAVASGLHMVHEYQSTQDWLNTHPFRKHHLPAIPSQHIVDDRRYGRHGDIKAENILHFVDDTVDNDLGSLVIADFGLTDFHKRATRSEVPAGHVTGSPSYEPPELMLHSKISRAYDIWSLACVYLEFITWLVCGWDDLERFPQARSLIGVQNTVDDDTFFTVLEGKPPTAEIRESVRDWIADLHEQPRCSAFIHDLLSLISEQMLVVDPADRIRCGPLNWTLKGMITKAERHPEYLTKPSPTSPRNQRPHPLSLAGFKANDKNRPPGPLEDFSPPKRQSTSLGLHSMRPLATCA